MHWRQAILRFKVWAVAGQTSKRGIYFHRIPLQDLFQWRLMQVATIVPEVWVCLPIGPKRVMWKCDAALCLNLSTMKTCTWIRTRGGRSGPPGNLLPSVTSLQMTLHQRASGQHLNRTRCLLLTTTVLRDSENFCRSADVLQLSSEHKSWVSLVCTARHPQQNYKPFICHHQQTTNPSDAVIKQGGSHRALDSWPYPATAYFNSPHNSKSQLHSYNHRQNRTGTQCSS